MAAFSGIPSGGFTFDLCKRNAWLEANNTSGAIMKKAKKTGTTIAGIVFKDGVVLGADTRATEGSIVADKNCQKIHYLAPNIFCCGAGTSADCENVTGLSDPCVGNMKNIVYQGYISAALIVGGVDHTGPSLFTVYPHGSVDQLPFVTMGSGSLAAMAIFEAGYQEGLDKEAAINLVRASITAGIMNDLGSGSNVDITVISPGNVERFRNIDKSDQKYKSKNPLKYAPGTTAYFNETISKFKITVTEGEGMDD